MSEDYIETCYREAIQSHTLISYAGLDPCFHYSDGNNSNIDITTENVMISLFAQLTSSVIAWDSYAASEEGYQEYVTLSSGFHRDIVVADDVAIVKILSGNGQYMATYGFCFAGSSSQENITEGDIILSTRKCSITIEVPDEAEMKLHIIRFPMVNALLCCGSIDKRRYEQSHQSHQVLSR